MTVGTGLAPAHVGELHSDSLADVIERLHAEFGPQVPLAMVVTVVRRGRRELDIISGPPLPELLERLARQRLSNLVERHVRLVRPGHGAGSDATSTMVAGARR